MGQMLLREPVVIDAVAEPQRVTELRLFVTSASPEEVVARLARLETRLIQLDERLRAVRDIVDDAAL